MLGCLCYRILSESNLNDATDLYLAIELLLRDATSDSAPDPLHPTMGFQVPMNFYRACSKCFVNRI